jgi:hypothetical protein
MLKALMFFARRIYRNVEVRIPRSWKASIAALENLDFTRNELPGSYPDGKGGLEKDVRFRWQRVSCDFETSNHGDWRREEDDDSDVH